MVFSDYNTITESNFNTISPIITKLSPIDRTICGSQFANVSKLRPNSLILC